MAPLKRLRAVTHVVLLQADALDRQSLARINAYNPGLSSAWMLQRAMSVRVNEDLDRDQINRMLAANFSAMAARGDAFMRPFLQVRGRCPSDVTCHWARFGSAHSLLTAAILAVHTLTCSSISLLLRRLRA